jgi:phage shock protein E
LSPDPALAAVTAGAALFVIYRVLGGRKVATNIVKQKIDSGATLIDVRSPEEFRDGSYPGALNIPVQAIAANLGSISKEKPVILFCASGARSSVAARVLKSAGFKDVLNAGGLGDMPR